MKKTNLFLQKKRRNRIFIIFCQISLLIVFLFAWELLAKKGVINAFLFSKPSEIYHLFISYLKTGEIWRHLGISVYETILGLLFGTLIGLIIAILIWWNTFLAKILEPYLIVLNALPKTALAPILIIWAGTGITGITIVAMSISLVLTIITAYNAFILIEEDKIKMLKSFNATKWQILWKLVLPSTLPQIVSIIKINIGMSWVGVIVGEFIVSRYGIGYLIMYGSQIFRMDLVMMGIIVLAIVAFLMYEIVNIIEKQINKRRE